MTHLDAATLSSYRAKRLPPATLLAADEHLSGCEECREALLDHDGATAADSLIDALTGNENEHLSYDRLEAWVDGTLSPRDHRVASGHLQSCSRCVADLADLRDVARSTPRVAVARNGMSLRIAAVILLAIIGVASWIAATRTHTSSPALATPATPLLTIQDRNSVIQLQRDGSIRGVALSGAEAAALREALTNGRIDVAPRVTALQRARGTLMGNTAGGGFDIVSPIATMLRGTLPPFSWTQLGDGVTYRVEVYDEGRNLVLQSPPLHDLAWVSDRELPRGHDYVWQVIATHGSERVVAPRPPAPEAHFGVIDAAAAARLDAATRAGSHLVLALASAREGVVDDARHELEELRRLNPGSSQVQRLARNLASQ